MVLTKTITTTRLLGNFPLEIILNEEFAEQELLSEVCRTIKEKIPLYFSGQRSPIFDMGKGLFLKAKGLAYRRISYQRWHEKEFTKQTPLELDEEELSKIQRPTPQRFLGASGHYKTSSVNEEGVITTRLSEARPIGAMRLTRAIQEHTLAQLITRQDPTLTDYPLGYFKFKDFPFKNKGITIPCGGFLSLTLTPYDIRSIEYLAYQQNNDLNQKLRVSRESFQDDIINLHIHMGETLRKLHNARITHTCPHPDNFRIMPETKRLQLIDLDNAQYHHQSHEQFLGRVVLDINTLFNYGLSMMNKQVIYDLPKKSCPDYEVHRRYSRLLRCIHEKTQEDQNLRTLYYAALSVGYFDKEKTEIKPDLFLKTIETWTSTKTPLSIHKNDFTTLLRRIYQP